MSSPLRPVGARHNAALVGAGREMGVPVAMTVAMADSVATLAASMEATVVLEAEAPVVEALAEMVEVDCREQSRQQTASYGQRESDRCLCR